MRIFFSADVGWLSNGELATRILKQQEENIKIERHLEMFGPPLIERLLALRKTSLRKLAKEVGVSPTYLCRVRLDQTTISRQVFFDLSNLLEECEKEMSNER